MGKLPFRVGRGKKLSRRVCKCDNSLEGLAFLFDQFTLELDYKITIFKEKDNWKKKYYRSNALPLKASISHPSRQGFPFTSSGCFHGGIVLCGILNLM